MAACRAEGHLPPIVWWHLVEVIDERTVKLRSDESETRTLQLACIGRAKDNRAAVAYMTKRLRDQNLVFWSLETTQTNWYERPMCLILDMNLPGRGGEAVYDFPTLNEELLAWGYAPFKDVKVTGDPYNLKARLLQANADRERRDREKKERWKELKKKHGIR
jgi:hypothetical protein